MALPIVFNNQTYNTNFLSQDNDGVQNNVFENEDNNPQPYTLNGTVNAVGDPVVFTSSNGSDQFTAYATNLDNPNKIVFSDNADGSGIAIIASNTQLLEGGALRHFLRRAWVITYLFASRPARRSERYAVKLQSSICRRVT